MSKIGTYITETRGELKRVTWPTKRQALAYTVTVILISVFVALFLGLFDYIFTLGLQKFVLR
ncbi:MAG: Protein translocase complex, SecE/Sec61-gamma subunit [Parcubacteria group bacterium]|nr:Protein translocase complex, SecE/Sec61-gamma subunit [Parcubacteria group bacterium]